ncbi:MAG: transposase [Candidatus Heimdallarchaeota archaeon]|nr:transposase [Candidatus Heimdallarchaeota archaeon]
MKTKQVKIRVKRNYSEEFKKARVQDYESGEYSVYEMCSLFGIHQQTIYNWIYKYSQYNKKGIKIVEMSESSTNKVKELHSRVKELERIIGQKQIHIDYLEKMIELAKDELGIDIKKNSSTPRSNGSGKTANQ